MADFRVLLLARVQDCEEFNGLSDLIVDLDSSLLTDGIVHNGLGDRRPAVELFQAHQHNH